MNHVCQFCSGRVECFAAHMCYTVPADARSVPVAELRRHIEHLERIVHVDWHSSIGHPEQAACSDRARRVGGELIGMICNRATPDDMARRERAIERSTKLIARVEGV